MQKPSWHQNYWNFGPTGKGSGKKVYLRFSRMVRSHLGIPREVVLGRFPFNQNVRFKFSATSISEWNSILQNFQKGDNLARYTQIFGNFFPEVFFPFNFAPGISRIFGRKVRISEIQQLSKFLETFQGKFLYHLPLFPNFQKFWLNGKGPSFWKFWKMLFHSLLEVAENSNRTFWLNGKRPCFSGRNVRNGN